MSARLTPQKFVLFGSAARETMGQNSDYDLLVIKAGMYDSFLLATTIRLELRYAEAAIDIVVVTPEEVERYRNCHCMVICPAM